MPNRENERFESAQIVNRFVPRSFSTLRSMVIEDLHDHGFAPWAHVYKNCSNLAMAHSGGKLHGQCRRQELETANSVNIPSVNSALYLSQVRRYTIHTLLRLTLN